VSRPADLLKARAARSRTSHSGRSSVRATLGLRLQSAATTSPNACIVGHWIQGDKYLRESGCLCPCRGQPETFERARSQVPWHWFNRGRSSQIRSSS
jgi:hypothetical protein